MAHGWKMHVLEDSGKAILPPRSAIVHVIGHETSNKKGRTPNWKDFLAIDQVSKEPVYVLTSIFIQGRGILEQSFSICSE